MNPKDGKFRLIPQSFQRRRVHKEMDTYIISFPKCGRTWLRMILGVYLNNKYKLGIDLSELTEVFRFSRKLDVVDTFHFSHDDRPNLKLVDDIEEDKSKYKGKKIIFLIRDPRDVVVSYYYQYMHRGSKENAGDAGYDGSISDFLHYERASLKSLIKFYNIWASNRDTPQLLEIVRYEDLKEQTFETVKKVLKVILKDELDENVLKEAIEFCDFENLKDMEQEGRLNSDRYGGSGGKELKTRKGIVGGFAKEFNDSDLKFLEDYLDQNLSSYYSYYKK